MDLHREVNRTENRDRNPAKGESVWAAGSYFLKSSEPNVAQSSWLGRLMVVLALLGSLAAAYSGRGRTACCYGCPCVLRAIRRIWKRPNFVPTWWPCRII